MFKYSEFMRVLSTDIERNFNTGVTLRLKIFSKKYKLLFFFRLLQFVERNNYNIVVTKIIRKIYNRYQFMFGVEINSVNIGEGLYLPHPNGIVIHPKVVIGKNCSILQQVTIGNNGNKGLDNLAIIGNNVAIGAGVKIIGPVKIGNNVTIGANSVVVKDIPHNVVAAGVPAKIIKKLDRK